MKKVFASILIIFTGQFSSAAVWNIHVAGYDIQLTGELTKSNTHIGLKNVKATEMQTGSSYNVGYFLEDTLIQRHLMNSVQFQFPWEVCNQLASEWGFKHNSANSTYDPIDPQNSSKLLIFTNRNS